MITTKDDALYEKALDLRNDGASPSFKVSEPWHMENYDGCGLNYRMPDLLGAVGCGQMDKMETILAERARIAAVYIRLLSRFSHVITPMVALGHVHSWQSYVIRVSDMAMRNAIMRRLAEGGVESRPGTRSVH